MINGTILVYEWMTFVLFYRESTYKFSSSLIIGLARGWGRGLGDGRKGEETRRGMALGGFGRSRNWGNKNVSFCPTLYMRWDGVWRDEGFFIFYILIICIKITCFN